MAAWVAVAGLLLSAALAVPSGAAPAGSQCLDNDGLPVAWWFMYKLPNGYTVAYLDATDRPVGSPCPQHSHRSPSRCPLAPVPLPAPCLAGWGDPHQARVRACVVA